MTVYYEKVRCFASYFLVVAALCVQRQMVGNLVPWKWPNGETVIVDGTHITPDKIEHFRPWVENIATGLFVVDLMQNNSLSLLRRNQTRMHYDWVKPDVIKMMYEQYEANPNLHLGPIRFYPIGWKKSLGQRERTWALFTCGFCIPDKVKPERFSTCSYF